jgi:hypothetical protein
VAYQESIAQKTLFDGCSIHYYNANVLFGQESNRDLFNFNPAILKDFFNADSNTLKNKMPENSSLFMAFVSKSKSEDQIIHLAKGKIKINITNRKVEGPFSSNNKDFKPENGLVLSSLFNLLPSKRNSFIKFNKDFLTTDKNNRLLEVLVYPYILSSMDRRIIETYLSVKYGISLSSNSNYYNSAGTVIWDTLYNSKYNNRVTGIGRDDALNLYQKQSKNSQFDGLTLSLDNVSTSNADNKGKLNNLSFLLWGDNDQGTKLKTGEFANYSKIDRVWKTQPTFHESRELTVQLVIKPDLFFENYDSSNLFPLWLVQFSEKDSNDLIVTKQDAVVDLIRTFSNVKIDSAKSKPKCFTFIQAPDFFSISKINYDGCKCLGKGNINLQLFGGAPPFSISVSSSNYSTNFTTSDRYSKLQKIPSGIYQLEFVDSKGSVFTNKVKIENDVKNIMLSLKDRINLNENGEALIGPDSDDQVDQLSFDWSRDNKNLGQKPELLVRDTGVYSLTVTNDNGCSKKYQVFVGSSQTGEDIVSIFPNPVLVYEKFTLIVALNKVSDIEINIYDAESKCLKTIKQKNLQSYTCTDELENPGVYLLSVKTNSKQNNLKLIVTQ